MCEHALPLCGAVQKCTTERMELWLKSASSECEEGSTSTSTAAVIHQISDIPENEKSWVICSWHYYPICRRGDNSQRQDGRLSSKGKRTCVLNDEGAASDWVSGLHAPPAMLSEEDLQSRGGQVVERPAAHKSWSITCCFTHACSSE